MKPFAKLATLITSLHRHVDKNNYLANDWLARGACLLPDNLFSRPDSLGFNTTFKILHRLILTCCFYLKVLCCILSNDKMMKIVRGLDLMKVAITILLSWK